MSPLENVKVGQTILIHNGGGWSLREVESKTKLHLTAGNRKFRLRDGRLVGGDTWCRVWIEIPTAKQIESLKAETLRRNAIQYLREYRWDTCMTSTLETIIKIATSAPKVK